MLKHVWILYCTSTMLWLCWIVTISTSKFFVTMVLVNWRQPKSTSIDLKTLLCKKLLDQEGKIIVLTSDHFVVVMDC